MFMVQYVLEVFVIYCIAVYCVFTRSVVYFMSGRSLALSGESGFTATERLQGESVNYVNIPVSPMSKRQLHYMELDLQDVQETGHTVRGEQPCLLFYHYGDIIAMSCHEYVNALYLICTILYRFFKN